MITEKGDVTTSYLLIQNADLADSGKYQCSPSNADVASVRVHVLNGKCFTYYHPHHTYIKTHSHIPEHSPYVYTYYKINYKYLNGYNIIISLPSS